MRSRPCRFPVLALVLAAVSHPVSAATFDVYTAEDLVQALQIAQSATRSTTIRVHEGEYLLTSASTDEHGPSALPVVRTAVILTGDHRDTTILRVGTDARHMTVVRGGNLTIRNLTLTGGGFTANDDSVGGGALANFGGVLYIAESALTDNGTGSGNGAYGGAIAQSGGSLVVNDSVLSGNRISGYGGAIAILGGTLTVRRSLLLNNFADHVHLDAGAGAIYVARKSMAAPDPRVILQYVTISGNGTGYPQDRSARPDGGGILNNGGRMLIENSSITGNHAFGSERSGAGGIGNTGLMTIRNSTIADNVTSGFGGGIENSGTLWLFGVTLIRNESEGLTGPYCDTQQFEVCSGGGGLWNHRTNGVFLDHSVIAENSATRRDGTRVLGDDCGGARIYISGYSGIGNTTDCTFRTGIRQTSLFDFAPLLGELAKATGPGKIHARPLHGSPLIDAGQKPGNGACTPRDQLDQLRNDGDFDGVVRCDIGSVEAPVQ